MFKLFREYIFLNIDVEHESLMVHGHMLLKMTPLCRPVATSLTLIMNPKWVMFTLEVLLKLTQSYKSVLTPSTSEVFFFNSTRFTFFI